MLSLRRMNEAEIRLLYANALTRDFPPSELKSLSAILNMYHKGLYDVLGAYYHEQLVGYALLYCPSDDRLVLLDYLAIEPQYRKQGIGSEMLALLRSHYASCADALMIECERPKAAPDEREARNRIRFYTQAGAVLTNVRIWLFGVEYSILVLPCMHKPIPQWDWSDKMLDLYRQMLPSDLFEHNVRLIRA